MPSMLQGWKGAFGPSRIHEGELGAAEGPTVDQTIEDGGASGGGAGKFRGTGGKQSSREARISLWIQVRLAARTTSDMFSTESM